MTDIGELNLEINRLNEEIETLRGPHCSSCGKSIDPDYCHCGDRIDHSAMDAGHSPVPMGCVCGYLKQDWEDRAQDLQRLVWRLQKTNTLLAAQLNKAEAALSSIVFSAANPEECAQKALDAIQELRK